AVEACGEEDEAASERGELVAVAAGQAFQQALADEAAEVVGHLAHGVGTGQVLFDQGPQVPGVEAAEDGAELAEGAEQGDHARVGEAEAGRPAAGLAGGHDQGLEEAGGWCRATALALQFEQAAIEVATKLNEAG